MKVEDLILVSIDDHVVEPPDMFDRHAPAKYRDRVPHVVMGDDGIEKWLFEGQQIGSMGLNAVVTWPKEEWGFDPVGFAEMRPGAYDIHERVRDMNRNGILASMCFPTFAGFAAACSRRRPTRTSRSPPCRPTTTGTSTSGARRTPTGSSRSPSRRSGTRSWWPTRCAASRPRGAGRSPCPSCRTSRACPATSTPTTGTRSSARCRRSRS